MAERISLRELARRLGRAEASLHTLAASWQILKGADGKFDEAAVRAALAASTYPSRQPEAFTAVHGTANAQLRLPPRPPRPPSRLTPPRHGRRIESATHTLRAAESDGARTTCTLKQPDKAGKDDRKAGD